MKNKKFAFVSDFDGTLTLKDFYLMIIDDYLGSEGQALLREWKNSTYKDKDFLKTIYSAINRNEEEILEDIRRIKWDEYACHVIRKIQRAGGDFIILSAGVNYYIERALKEKALKKIKVYANTGIYKNKGIHLKIEPEGEYFSEDYGIDKAKVIKALKENYDVVYFAGDSAPDVEASKEADKCFAKGKLKALLENEGVSFVPIEDYRDIEVYLKKNNFIDLEE